MTNWWEKVNVSAAVAGVIVGVAGIAITLWNQEIRCLINSSGNNCSKNIFCMKNTRIQAGSSESYDSDWKCVKESTTSDWIELGDDNLWKSYLEFKAESHLKSPNTKICAFYSRLSSDSGNTIKENKCSEKSNNYENKIELGDDTGWINQKLAFTISSPKNYQICLELLKQEKRENPNLGRRPSTGWICNSENPDNYIDLGDDFKYYNQVLKFKIIKQ
ncbi:MAG: hypothetical protein F6K48_13715 [Okeania sp. SIO3H1]|uniref:hypothetical protein n=1 Tax=Okeania sp. SIO1I7 TaxID=2607772 RepID=UPI0013CC15C7|nr:hypothetical protein [Okeania sp. SIO1I7]NEN89906.1 hypothetical protein [Okeania sp. SIO3H1]NET26657.1 hypothetical protein [Okeania sp. SIO1I7]